MIEVNALVETLRHQRLDALEATTLLRKVMAEIDVAVFTFDEEHELKFVNRAGARLLSQPAERLLGRRADGARSRRTAWPAKRRASSTPRFPAASAAGRSAAASSARAAGRTSCSCCRT